MNLNTYVTSRVLTLEVTLASISGLRKGCCRRCITTAVEPQVHLAISQASQNIDTLLESCFLAGNNQVAVWCQRSSIEGANENIARRNLWTRYRIIRTLAQQCPGTAFFKEVNQIGTISSVCIWCIELTVLLLFIGENNNLSDGTLGTTIHFNDFSTNRRYKGYIRHLLIEEDLVTCFYSITNSYGQFWNWLKAKKVRRLNSNSCYGSSIFDVTVGFSFQKDIVATLQDGHRSTGSITRCFTTKQVVQTRQKGKAAFFYVDVVLLGLDSDQVVGHVDQHSKEEDHCDTYQRVDKDVGSTSCPILSRQFESE